MFSQDAQHLFQHLTTLHTPEIMAEAGQLKLDIVRDRLLDERLAEEDPFQSALVRLP